VLVAGTAVFGAAKTANGRPDYAAAIARLRG
jgi:hypothetical protein